MWSITAPGRFLTAIRSIKFVSESGSGVSEALTSLIPRVELCGIPSVVVRTPVASGAVIVFPVSSAEVLVVEATSVVDVDTPVFNFMSANS